MNANKRAFQPEWRLLLHSNQFYNSIKKIQDNKQSIDVNDMFKNKMKGEKTYGEVTMLETWSKKWNTKQPRRRNVFCQNTLSSSIWHTNGLTSVITLSSHCCLRLKMGTEILAPSSVIRWHQPCGQCSAYGGLMTGCCFIDPFYSAKLLRHARQLYTFATTYKGKYSDSITDADNYYR